MDDVTPASTGRDDAELLRAAGVDPTAFRELYDRHAHAIHAFCLSRTRHHETALDLTAEVFAQAWQSRARFEDQRSGSARPWLFGIARNLVLAAVRERRLQREASERLGLERQGDVAEPDASWLDGLDDGLASALAGLPSAQREAVQLRTMQDLSYNQVAEALECSPTAARIKVSRGLAAMRSALGADADEGTSR